MTRPRLRLLATRDESGPSYLLWFTATVLLANFLMASALVESCGAVAR